LKRKCFVINLDHSHQRLETISDLLGKAGIEFERIPAVYGAKVPNVRTHLSFWSSVIMLRKMSPAEIGCYLSHKLIWNKMIEEHIDGFPENFKLEEWSIRESGFDLLRFHILGDSKRARKTKLMPTKREGVFYEAAGICASTAAMLITNSGARKMVARRKILAPIDLFCLHGAFGRLNHAIVFPNLFDVSADKSTIGGTRHLPYIRRKLWGLLRDTLFKKLNSTTIARMKRETDEFKIIVPS
jgi:GR25 family glycosyltransferase involved in LPS biosynthesis